MSTPDWWHRPRKVFVLVDTPGWITPFARQLVEILHISGDDVSFIEEPVAIGEGGITFLLNCRRLLDESLLARSRRTLVAHASALPHGRGMSPWAWQILEGHDHIPLSLFEAVGALDAGPVYRQERIELRGDELVDEIRARIGRRIIALGIWFMSRPAPPPGMPQRGEPSYYRSRRPADSRLDPQASLASQFDLLRIVDNEAYPAFFDYRGRRYRLRIDQLPDPVEHK